MAGGGDYYVTLDEDGAEKVYNVDDVVCTVCGSGEQEEEDHSNQHSNECWAHGVRV